MSFSATLWPGIPPRSWPPCPASITTVTGEPLSPELRLLFAAYALVAKNVTSRPATDKPIGNEFLRITGRCSVLRVDEPRALVLWYPWSARAFRSCRHGRLPRQRPNEQDEAASWFP